MCGEAQSKVYLNDEPVQHFEGRQNLKRLILKLDLDALREQFPSPRSSSNAAKRIARRIRLGDHSIHNSSRAARA
jgi:hypothetical protein